MGWAPSQYEALPLRERYLIKEFIEKRNREHPKSFEKGGWYVAAIQEELTLVDKFSTTFSKFIRLGEKVAGVTDGVNAATRQVAQSP